MGPARIRLRVVPGAPGRTRARTWKLLPEQVAAVLERLAAPAADLAPSLARAVAIDVVAGTASYASAAERGLRVDGFLHHQDDTKVSA